MAMVRTKRPCFPFRYQAGGRNWNRNGIAPYSKWRCLAHIGNKQKKKEVEASGLTWSVVESIPVHEDIKKERETTKSI